MNILKKSNLIISLIIIAAGVSSPAARAEDDKEHEKAHKMLENKMLADWRSTMTVVTSSADDFLDMGDKMIIEGRKAKDPVQMQKGAELMKIGVKMSQQVIDYDHEYLAKEIPHEIMHKNHMRIKTKLTGLISDRSKDFVSLGEEFVKSGKSKNDSDMLINGAKLLTLGMEIQMMNHPKE